MKKAPTTMPAAVRKLRCAVYTRKSSEEGLDMEFNSLDAQRESCEAYITSQRAESASGTAMTVDSAPIPIIEPMPNSAT